MGLVELRALVVALPANLRVRSSLCLSALSLTVTEGPKRASLERGRPRRDVLANT